MRKCLECQELFDGRSDKKFCSQGCKSSYHYKEMKQSEVYYNSIDKQLKTNRKLLKYYNKAGKAFIRKEIIINKGFNPTYTTHHWTAQNGNKYLFCYEYGFMEVINQGKLRYIIIQWQAYMNSSNYEIKTIPT